MATSLDDSVRVGPPPAVRRRWMPQNKGKFVMTLLVTAAVAYLVLAPLALMILASFKSKQDILPFESAPFTLHNYAEVYLRASTYKLLSNTLVFTVGALIIGIGGAVALSWLVERTNIPCRNLIFGTILIPLAVPGMLDALAWVFLLDRHIGLLNILVRKGTGNHSGSGPVNIYSLYGMIVVQGLRMIPTAFLMISGSFRRMDPELEDASRIFGRGIFATLPRITMPLMRPAILAATIYFFVSSIEAFEIPGVLGLSAHVYVFSTRIYLASHPNPGFPNYGEASTLATLLLIIAGTLLWLYGRLTKRANQFTTITGKGYRSGLIDLGRWRWVAFGGYVTYFVVSVLLPFIILLWASLHSYYQTPSWSGLKTINLSAYRTIFHDANFSTALKNTAIMAVVAATVTMLLVSMVSWLVVRSRSRFSRVLDFLVFLPQAVPSLIIGLAVLFVYLSFRNPIYGSVWIIAIALVTKYLAFGSRTMNAAFMQIHPELEEAAEVSGSSWLMTYRRIIFPLIAPVFINGWIWVVIHSARELSAALMLGTPSNQVLATIVWNDYQNGNFAAAAAVGVLLILALSVIVVGGRWLVTRRTAVGGVRT